MPSNCRNLIGTVLLESLTTSCWLYTWEQTNSSNKFAANLNMKAVSFFLTHPVYKFVVIRPDYKRNVM